MQGLLHLQLVREGNAKPSMFSSTPGQVCGSPMPPSPIASSSAILRRRRYEIAAVDVTEWGVEVEVLLEL